MKVFPGLEEVRRIAKGGDCRVLPLSCEMLSDRLTPIAVISWPRTRPHCPIA